MSEIARGVVGVWRVWCGVVWCVLWRRVAVWLGAAWWRGVAWRGVVWVVLRAVARCGVVVWCGTVCGVWCVVVCGVCALSGV